MTDQPKVEQPDRMMGGVVSTPVRDPEKKGRTAGEAIKAGLCYLAGRWQGDRWQDSAFHSLSDTCATALVLARLHEVPAEYKTHNLGRKVELGLDWLMRARDAEGSWGARPGNGDACSTAWSVLALRMYGRSVPKEALDFLRSCRRHDGGFALSPVVTNGRQVRSAPDATAVAVRALGELDWAIEDFLASYLRTSGSAVPATRALRFQVCAEILDWRQGLASPALLNQVRQIVAGFGNEGAFDRAALLRCLHRLRLQRAWSLAAGLRAMQLEDGSWTDHEDRRILTTATAVSALALGESQPGLYFGSDLPLPRRLYQL